MFNLTISSKIYTEFVSKVCLTVIFKNEKLPAANIRKYQLWCSQIEKLLVHPKKRVVVSKQCLTEHLLKVAVT